MQLIGFQGDATFFKVGALPTGLKQDSQTKAGIIANGVLSGHAHQFEDMENVELWKAEDGLIYADVKIEAVVTHGRSRTFSGVEADLDYHNPIKLDPGIYAIGIVEETDWLSGVIRQVID